MFEEELRELLRILDDKYDDGSLSEYEDGMRDLLIAVVAEDALAIAEIKAEYV